jgi:hypothetical protein
MEASRATRLLRRLLIVWLCFFVTVVTLSHFMDDLAFAFYAGLPLCISWLVLAGASVALCGQFVSQRRWLLSLLVVLLPLLVPTVALRTVWFWQDVTDIAHFRTMRAEYDAEVARLPNSGSRFHEWNWGGLLFASRGITYDETDQLALPPDQQSARLKARMRNTDLFCGGDTPIGEVRPLGRHYYLTGFGC